MKYRYLILLILFNLPLRANPVEGFFAFDDSWSGTSVLPFLKLQPNARSLSMGASLSAIDKGAQSYFSNPALLSTEEILSLSINHAEILGEWQHESAVISFPMFMPGTWALALNAVHSSDYSDSRDELENPSNFSTSDLAIGTAYGYSLLKDQLDLGASFEYLQSRIDDITGRGYSLNLGLRAYLIGGLQSAVVLKNISHGFRYRANGPLEKSPFLLQTSLGLPLGPEWPFAFQISYEKSNEGLQIIAGGYEHALSPWFFLRTGYRYMLSSNDQGFLNGASGGFGLLLGPFALDYGAQYRENLGWHQIFSLQFGSFPTHLLAPKTSLQKANEAFQQGNCQEAQSYSREALKENPSEINALLILDNCNKEKALNDGKIFNLIISANTRGQLTPIKVQDQLLGGLPRRSSLIEALRSRNQKLFLSDGGHWQDFSQENRNTLIDQSYEAMNYDYIFNDSASQEAKIHKKNIQWVNTQVEIYSLNADSLDSTHIFDLFVKSAELFKTPFKKVLFLSGNLQQATDIARKFKLFELISLSGDTPLTSVPLEINEVRIISPGQLGTHLAWIQFSTDSTSNYFFHKNLEIHSGLVPNKKIRDIIKSEVLFPEDTLHFEAVPLAQKNRFLFLKCVDPISTEFCDLYLKELQNDTKPLRLNAKPIEFNEFKLAHSRDLVAYSSTNTEGENQLFIQSIYSKKAIPLLTKGQSAISFEWDSKENKLWYWIKTEQTSLLKSVSPSSNNTQTHYQIHKEIPGKLVFSNNEDYLLFEQHSDDTLGSTLFLTKTYYFNPRALTLNSGKIMDYCFSFSKELIYLLIKSTDKTKGIELLKYQIKDQAIEVLRTNLSTTELYSLPDGILIRDPHGLTEEILFDEINFKERVLVSRKDLEVNRYSKPHLVYKDKPLLIMNQSKIDKKEIELLQVDFSNSNSIIDSSLSNTLLDKENLIYLHEFK